MTTITFCCWANVRFRPIADIRMLRLSGGAAAAANNVRMFAKEAGPEIRRAAAEGPSLAVGSRLSARALSGRAAVPRPLLRSQCQVPDILAAGGASGR